MLDFYLTFQGKKLPKLPLCLHFTCAVSPLTYYNTVATVTLWHYIHTIASLSSVTVADS